jgi:hypothetical protein
MAITSGVPDSAKVQFLTGTHIAADVYKIALFLDTATLGPTVTTAYAATNETSGAGYTAGGKILTNFTSGTASSKGYISFDDPQWTGASFTARGALIYNSSKTNAAIAIIDFGQNYTATNGTFTVDLPAAGASAVITLT